MTLRIELPSLEHPVMFREEGGGASYAAQAQYNT